MKVPFGLHRETNDYIGIDEADRGLACDCICPSCGMRLQARKGKEREYHFSHHKAAQKEDCQYSYWVSVRSMAKQLIGKYKKISFNYKTIKALPVSPYRDIVIFQVTLDPRVKEYQFDLKVSSSIGDFYIYFLTDEEDNGRARMHYNDTRVYFNDWAVLEIDLSSMKQHDRNAGEHLRSLLFDRMDNKNFLLPEKKFQSKEILPSQEQSKEYAAEEALIPEEVCIESFYNTPDKIREEAYTLYKNNCPKYFNQDRDKLSFDVIRKKEDMFKSTFFIRYYGEYFGAIRYDGYYYVFKVENDMIIPYAIKERSIYMLKKRLKAILFKERERFF